jgi:hypothetical protein
VVPHQPHPTNNITTALKQLDMNAEAITTAIDKLRQNHQ